jgi:hypothetical protein
LKITQGENLKLSSKIKGIKEIICGYFFFFLIVSFTLPGRLSTTSS